MTGRPNCARHLSLQIDGEEWRVTVDPGLGCVYLRRPDEALGLRVPISEAFALVLRYALRRKELSDAGSS